MKIIEILPLESIYVASDETLLKMDIIVELYKLADSIERVMNMFSEELLELDKGTVQYMIDEMQETIDSQKAQLADKDSQLADKDAKIADKNAKIADKDAEIARLKALLATAQ